MLLGLIEPTPAARRACSARRSATAARARGSASCPSTSASTTGSPGRELLRFHGRLYGLGGAALERAHRRAARARRPARRRARAARASYSKGMLQRVGLAQALLNEPELVFLDEPTSGLDPLGRLLVRDIIRELRAGGTSVFLNSHLLGEVEATCDRVVFVKQGRTVHELALAGTPRRRSTSSCAWRRDAGSRPGSPRSRALGARSARARPRCRAPAPVRLRVARRGRAARARALARRARRRALRDARAPQVARGLVPRGHGRGPEAGMTP